MSKINVELTEKEIKSLVDYLGHTNDKMVVDACDWLDKEEARKQAKEVMRVYVKLSDIYYE